MLLHVTQHITQHLAACYPPRYRMLASVSQHAAQRAIQQFTAHFSSNSLYIAQHATQHYAVHYPARYRMVCAAVLGFCVPTVASALRNDVYATLMWYIKHDYLLQILYTG